MRWSAVILLLLGCSSEPEPDSAYRHGQSILEVTKKWLGIKPAPPPSLAAVATSRVDEHQGRLRRRLNLTLKGAFGDREIKDEISRRIGEKQFTERLHIGAILIWSPQDQAQPLALGVYTRDGRGWTGQPCDHLRIAGRGDPTFASLVEELGRQASE